MQIPREQAEKLKRYFINADPFLWGLIEGNKEIRLRYLKKHFLKSYSDTYNPTYSKINQDLLVTLGIDGILERIVVPKVKRVFADVLRHFQRCWDQGQNPEMQILTENKLYTIRVPGRPIGRGGEPAQIFLQIDTQHNFVERWTVFAGLWFEEIEPLLDSGGESVSESSDAKSGLPVSIDYVDSAEAFVSSLEQLEDSAKRLRPQLKRLGKLFEQRIGRIHKGQQELDQSIIDDK